MNVKPVHDALVFGIVLYHERIEESASYQSLLKSFRSYSSNGDTLNKLFVIIFDNTPTENKEIAERNLSVEDNTEVIYFTEGINRGISYAYNHIAGIAGKRNKEWLVFLDQDTHLPNNFYETYLHADKKQKIYCPVILSGDYQLSPTKYINYRAAELFINKRPSIPLRNVTCINSGLMVNLNLLLSIGGYDEKLFLDFCDHDFIDRIKKSGIQELGILPLTLKQNFSNDTHTLSQAVQRYRIFLKDLKVFGNTRNWIKVFLFIDIARLLSLTLKFKSMKFIALRFRSNDFKKNS